MHIEKSGIYRILNTVNGKQYIGSSKDLDSRKNKHFNRLNRNDHENEHLQRAFNIYGEQAFLFEILLECSEGDLIQEEQQFIDEAVAQNGRENLYNICPTADRRIIAEETRKKISIANSGRHPSEETKKKQSLANSGENHPNFGEPRSEETKKKLSIINFGENNPMFGKIGENSPGSKLTNSQAEEIRLMVKNGIKQIDLAKKFEVCNATISKIVNNKTYKQSE